MLGLTVSAQHQITLNPLNNSVKLAILDTTIAPMAKSSVFSTLLNLNSYNQFIQVDSFSLSPTKYVLKFEQYYKGMYIDGAKVHLFYEQDKLYQIIGHYAPVNNLDTTATLSIAEAEAIYANYYNLQDSVDVEYDAVKTIEFNTDGTNAIAHPALLAYHIISSQVLSNILIIDAQDGTVIGEIKTAHFSSPQTAQSGIQEQSKALRLPPVTSQEVNSTETIPICELSTQTAELETFYYGTKNALVTRLLSMQRAKQVY
jgi:Zn-dependent metalloprotease